jgi:IMP cyclohydrolase
VSGYEKDEYNTPRIAGIVGSESFIGIIRRDGIEVQEVRDAMFVSTYDKNSPERLDFEAQSAREIIDEMYGMGFENPICSVGIKKGELVEFSLDNKKFN